MAHVKGEIFIRRPPEQVFDFVADERNEPEYNPRLARVEQLSDGPIGVGTQFHADVATRRGLAPVTIEWTRFERPSRLDSATRMQSMEILGGLTFDPVDGGTRMRWSWEIKPHGGLRLLGPLISRIGRRQEDRIWSALKRRLEETAHD